jgi:hypothetical protein
MTENHPDGRDDAAALGALFAEVLNDMEAVAAAITDTEIETRLQQLLQPSPETSDLAADLIDLDSRYPLAPDGTSIMNGIPRRLSTEEASRAWWEINVARAQVERDQQAAQELKTQAEEYLDAAVETAGGIVADARRESEKLIRGAEVEAHATQERTAEMIADAEALAKYIIGDAMAQASARSTGMKTGGSGAPVHGNTVAASRLKRQLRAFRDALRLDVLHDVDVLEAVDQLDSQSSLSELGRRLMGEVEWRAAGGRGLAWRGRRAPEPSAASGQAGGECADGRRVAAWKIAADHPDIGVLYVMPIMLWRDSTEMLTRLGALTREVAAQAGPEIVVPLLVLDDHHSGAEADGEAVFQHGFRRANADRDDGPEVVRGDVIVWQRDGDTTTAQAKEDLVGARPPRSVVICWNGRADEQLIASTDERENDRGVAPGQLTFEDGLEPEADENRWRGGLRPVT